MILGVHFLGNGASDARHTLPYFSFITMLYGTANFKMYPTVYPFCIPMRRSSGFYSGTMRLRHN